MNLDRKSLIEAMFSVMEVKIGMCTEEEARAVLKELQEKPYTIDLASSWESYLSASFWNAPGGGKDFKDEEFSSSFFNLF